MNHECPQDASIFVGQGNHGFLPATALSQGDGPLRDGIKVVFASQHDRLGSLYQQGAQVTVASLGDGSKVGFAPTGVLPGCQSQPGCELGTILELFEVTDGGNHSGCSQRP